MTRWFIGVAVAVLAGMGLSAWLGREAHVAAILAMTVGVAYASIWPERRRVAWLITTLAALWSGVLVYAHADGHWQRLPESVSFVGPVEIIGRGETRAFYRPITIRPLDTSWDGGDILYRAAIDFSGAPGERLDFQCPLSRPKNFEPGFDYRMLLAARGTGYVCERGAVMTPRADDTVINIRTFFARVQSGLRSRVNALVPEPESGLLVGLLIGGSDHLDPETQTAFARAGLSHIVAVSGYNMSIVSEGLVILALVFGLWRRWAVGLAAVGLAGFLLLIDGSAASLRAALMAWFAFGAYFVNRPAVSWNGLVIAATVMLLANPLLIRFDVGFQLSFLATLALLVFARHFETFAFFRTWYGKCVALFLTTVVIEIFTLPMILSTFGMLSLVAPFANTLVLPLVPLAMFVGIGAIIITTFAPGVGFLLTPFVWLPLTTIIRLVEWFSRFSWASMTGLDSTTLFAVCWYAGLGLAVFFFERLRRRYVLGMDH